MALPNGFFVLGRPVGDVTFPELDDAMWSAEINGTLALIEALGPNVGGILTGDELRFTRVEWLLAPQLNLSRPGLDAPLGAVIGGGWVGTDFDDAAGGFAAPVRLLLAHGNDSAEGSAGTDLIVGGAGDDVINGRGGRDYLDGGAGDDLILAAAGDTVDGQAGADTLALPLGASGGGPGWRVRLAEPAPAGFSVSEGNAESLAGDPAPIALYAVENVLGSAGDDDIAGSAAANRLEGRAGDDLIDGLAGDDTLIGGAGFDILSGGAGSDQVDGGAEDDQLWGGFGFDTLDGGEGIDTYLVEQPLFDGDPDLIPPTQADVDLGAGTALYVKMPGAAVTDAPFAWFGSALPGLMLVEEAGTHTLTGIENAVGGALTDRLLGSAGANLLDGGGSGDVLDGRSGDDTIIGGGGDDIMSGGAGFDTADYSGIVRGLHVRIWANTALSEATGSDTLSGFERVIGGAAGDTLVGALAGEELKGEAGADLIFGNDGDDTLWGGHDADTIRGELGNDRLFGDWAGDVLLGDDGADTLFGFFGDDVLYGWTGRDRLLGEQGNDTLLGEQGDDFLGGLEDNDRLLGGAGADVMFGDDGDDFLGGQTGADVLVGGRGQDTLWGDEGADLFFFRPEDLQAGVADRIFSFASAGPEADTIRLAAITPSSVSVLQVGADAAIRIALTGGGMADIIVEAAVAAEVNARLAYL